MATSVQELQRRIDQIKIAPATGGVVSKSGLSIIKGLQRQIDVQQPAPATPPPVTAPRGSPERTRQLIASGEHFRGVPDTAPSGTGAFDGQVPEVDPDMWAAGTNAEVIQARAKVEKAYEVERKDIERRRKDLQRQQDVFTKKQEDILKEADPKKGVSFEQEQRIIQNQLDAAEAASETLEKNFLDNQKAVAELEALWTQAMSEINLMKEVTGLASIRSPRIQATIDDYNARVGVLNAVMAARDGQIVRAQDMIARAQDSSAASKNEQIDYYNALLSFYAGQEGKLEGRIAILSKEDRAFATAQIGLLEGDLANAEATAQYIQDLMVSPDTAKLMQDAGITTNMSIEEINQRMARATAVAPTAPGVGVGDVGEGTGVPLTINQIEQFRRAYGWTPPLGYTFEDIQQFVAENPGRTPQELEDKAKEIAEGTIQTQTQTTFVEVIGHIMNTMTGSELNAMHRKAKKAKETKFLRGKFEDVKAYIEKVFRSQIEEAAQAGISAEDIKEKVLSL